MSEQDAQKPQAGLWVIFKSVLASFFGVQSQKNRERDFTQGKPMHFIIVGFALTIGFLLLMATLVSVILKFATP